MNLRMTMKSNSRTALHCFELDQFEETYWTVPSNWSCGASTYGAPRSPIRQQLHWRRDRPPVELSKRLGYPKALSFEAGSALRSRSSTKSICA